MRLSKHTHWWLVCCLVALCATSCNDDSCYDNGSAIPLARFYASGTTSQVSVSGLTVRGIDNPGDSLMVDSMTVNETFLPLRATRELTQWVLEYGDDIPSDTLSLHYHAIPYFSSAECGAMYNFEITKVDATTHVLDSVVLVTPLVDNVTRVTLRIYFPTP